MEKIFEIYNKRFNKIITNIQNQINKDNEIGRLISFLINTNINLYGMFGDKNYFKIKENPCVMEELIQILNYSLFDDGDITFIKTPTETKIFFKDKLDITYEDVYSKSVINTFEKLNKELPEFEIIPNIDDFIKISKELHVIQLKKWFKNDFKRNQEQAIKHYSKYEDFNLDWVKEFS